MSVWLAILQQVIYMKLEALNLICTEITDSSLKAMECLPPKQHAFVIFRLNVMSVWKCGLGAQCTLYKVYITSHQTAAYTV